jgi:hypothetical protein
MASSVSKGSTTWSRLFMKCPPCVLSARETVHKNFCMRHQVTWCALPAAMDTDGSLSPPTPCSKIPDQDGKMSIVYDKHVFHYIVEDGIIYLCMADDLEKVSHVIIIIIIIIIMHGRRPREGTVS